MFHDGTKRLVLPNEGPDKALFLSLLTSKNSAILTAALSIKHRP